MMQITCRSCGETIDNSAAWCPLCGDRIYNPIPWKPIFLVGGVVFIFVMLLVVLVATGNG